MKILILLKTDCPEKRFIAQSFSFYRYLDQLYQQRQSIYVRNEIPHGNVPKMYCFDFVDHVTRISCITGVISASRGHAGKSFSAWSTRHAFDIKCRGLIIKARSSRYGPVYLACPSWINRPVSRWASLGYQSPAFYIESMSGGSSGKALASMATWRWNNAGDAAETCHMNQKILTSSLKSFLTFIAAVSLLPQRWTRLAALSRVKSFTLVNVSCSIVG